jgi:hypothetical protein
MAIVNPNKPSGLSPVAYLNGSNYTGKGRLYSILAANTNPFYVGDLVVPVAGGGATAADSRGLPAITLATAGAVAVGVITAVGTIPDGGPYANPANLNQNFRPTGAQPINYYALVEDDPNVIYEIQEGGAGTNLTNAAVLRNANIVYAAPAAGVVVSGTTLDNGTVAVTATLNLKILSFARRPMDNAFVTSPATGGGAQKWWVMINNHYYRTGIIAL